MEAVKEREAWQSYKPGTDKSVDDVLLKQQQFFIYQVAHRGTSIKSPDGNPWIRAVGFTHTLDAARELAKAAHDCDDKTETRIMPCGRNFLIGSQKYNGLDLPLREKEQQKSNAMIDAHIEKRLKDISSAKSSASATPSGADAADALQSEAAVAKETGKLDDSEPIVLSSTFDVAALLRDDLHAASSSSNASSTSSKPSNLPLVGKLVQVHLQRVFALAVIQDEDDDAREPSVIALFACDGMQEIEPLVKEAQQSKDLLHFDVLVGPTTEWLPLYKPKSEKTLHQHPLRQELENNIRWLKPEDAKQLAAGDA